MRLMVIGDGQDTASLCAGLAGRGEHTLTYCVDSTEALQKLRSSTTDYQWVLLEKRGSCEEVRTIARQIKAMAPHLLLTLLTHYDREELERISLPPVVCAVERKPGGLQILRCAMHTARRANATALALGSRHTPLSRRAWSFEYHAPRK